MRKKRKNIFTLSGYSWFTGKTELLSSHTALGPLFPFQGNCSVRCDPHAPESTLTSRRFPGKVFALQHSPPLQPSRLWCFCGLRSNFCLQWMELEIFWKHVPWRVILRPLASGVCQDQKDKTGATLEEERDWCVAGEPSPFLATGPVKVWRIGFSWLPFNLSLFSYNTPRKQWCFVIRPPKAHPIALPYTLLRARILQQGGEACAPVRVWTAPALVLGCSMPRELHASLPMQTPPQFGKWVSAWLRVHCCHPGWASTVGLDSLKHLGALLKCFGFGKTLKCVWPAHSPPFLKPLRASREI